MPKPCCEYERNRQKRRSKNRETLAFFILKKIGVYNDREKENSLADSAKE